MLCFHNGVVTPPSMPIEWCLYRFQPLEVMHATHKRLLLHTTTISSR
jgi:hypothetical protein